MPTQNAAVKFEMKLGENAFVKAAISSICKLLVKKKLVTKKELLDAIAPELMKGMKFKRSK